MPRNALLSESKEATWPIPAAVFPGFDRLRVQPTVGVILDRARGQDVGRGDFLILASLKYALIARIISGDYRWVYDTLGQLFGFGITDVPSGNGCEADPRKPLAKATPR
jgi:hypothetical protein